MVAYINREPFMKNQNIINYDGAEVGVYHVTLWYITRVSQK